MDKLKELLAAKKLEAANNYGGKKYMKRSDLEEIRLQKLKEEEAAERARKEALKGLAGADTSGGEGAAASQESRPRPGSRQGDASASVRDATPVSAVAPLSKQEVIRRLRRLKEPATLFGETDDVRAARLEELERSQAIVDETAGGQQANFNIEYMRAAKKARQGGADTQGTKPKEAAEATPSGEPLDPKQQALLAAFRTAAESHAMAHLPLEDALARRLRGWMADWEADMEGRSDAVKQSPAGHQATVRYRETVAYLKPLFGRLKNRVLDPELLAGLKLIVDAMGERNYLHAYKIYMGIAIGNSPWPIGVTQVGLHERSAREKISFKSSMSAAHIMNDEATRKFIQALKRLMTFCQRRYPTDPSRSVDFDGFSTEGRGAAGGGSDKLALLEAIKTGENVAPAPAPSLMDGEAVKIPPRWKHQIRHAMESVAKSETQKNA